MAGRPTRMGTPGRVTRLDRPARNSGAGETALKALEVARLIQGLLNTAVLNAVRAAWHNGRSWGEIAVQLGISQDVARAMFEDGGPAGT